MDDKKLDRMEEMLSSLITITGNMNKKIQELGEELQSMKEEQKAFREELQGMKEEQKAFREELQGMKEEQKAFREELHSVAQEQNEMRSENEGRHHEILEKLYSLQVDQDYVWEKSARNEREIARIKAQLHQ